MKNILLACTFLVLCCSCESLILHTDGGARQYDGKAIITDYISGYNYEVLTIDGHPVNRVQHGRIVTRVPNIIIDPGRHTFGIRWKIIEVDHIREIDGAIIVTETPFTFTHLTQFSQMYKSEEHPFFAPINENRRGFVHLQGGAERVNQD